MVSRWPSDFNLFQSAWAAARLSAIYLHTEGKNGKLEFVAVVAKTSAANRCFYNLRLQKHLLAAEPTNLNAESKKGVF